MISKTMIVLSITMALSACSAVKVIEPKKYVLNGVSTQKLAKSASQYVVYVSDIKSESAYNSTDMLYTTQPFMLSTFSQNEWVAKPAQMLRPSLVASLQNTAYFKGVVTNDAISNARFQLNTTLLELRQNFIKKPSEINLALKVDVVDLKQDKVLASERFVENTATKQDSPYGGVMAANLATRKIMTKISTFVVNTVR